MLHDIMCCYMHGVGLGESQVGMSRAEQQAERSRMLADEEVQRLRGQLASLGSPHYADGPPRLQSTFPEHVGHRAGIDRCSYSAPGLPYP